MSDVIDVSADEVTPFKLQKTAQATNGQNSPFKLPVRNAPHSGRTDLGTALLKPAVQNAHGQVVHPHASNDRVWDFSAVPGYFGERQLPATPDLP